MFDALCVSEPMRRPWTMAVSLTGQVVMIGLAVLVPLLSTEGLPHRFWWVGVPEPPHASRPHSPKPVAQQTPAVPFQSHDGKIFQPPAVPTGTPQIIDPVDLPQASDDGVGVPFGIGPATGGSNSTIDTVLRSMPVAQPPAPVVRPAPPAPAAITRIKVGGLVQQGKLLSGPRPIYPQIAKAARVEGVVKLAAVISRDGTMLDLHVVSGPPLLIQAALDAVRHWVFRPTTLNGEVVEVATDIEVTFTLQK